MSLVDRVVADRLSLEVRRDRIHLQAVAVEDRPSLGDVGIVDRAAFRVEVVSGAGDLQSVVPP